MLDVWDRLHTLFAEESDEHPQIEIGNLNAKTVGAVVRYVLDYSIGLEADFAVRRPFQRVRIGSRKDAVVLLAGGQVVGELFMHLSVDFMRLPEMGLYVDGPNYLSLQYLTGPEWTPLMVTGLFEFLRFIQRHEPSAKFLLSGENLPRSSQELFHNTLKVYFNERYD